MFSLFISFGLDPPSKTFNPLPPFLLVELLKLENVYYVLGLVYDLVLIVEEAHRVIPVALEAVMSLSSSSDASSNSDEQSEMFKTSIFF